MRRWRPSDEDVARILARVLRQAKKDWTDLKSAWLEDDSEQLQQRAIQERLERRVTRYLADRPPMLRGGGPLAPFLVSQKT